LIPLSTGESIPAAALVWAFGGTARQVPEPPDVYTTSGTRIIVDEFNEVQGTQNIFAIGDQCFQTTVADYRNGHPQLAQVAIRRESS
jgi:NADH:ubiquinone reductase (H+-translocating)